MIKELKKLIDESRSTVFFGGAGVSTESGVPDFRSSQGLYTKVQGAEKFLNIRTFERDPEGFYRFTREHFSKERVLEPNAAHYGLAKLEQMGKLSAVITQNVDRLHQKAGSQVVYELHGRADTFTCRNCGLVYSRHDIWAMDLVPRCSCGAVLRSDVVLFGEKLNQEILDQAISVVKQADLMIIGGSSLKVYPAAGLLRSLPPGSKKVLINLEPGTKSVDLEINRPIGEVFTELMRLYDLEEVK